MIETLPFASVLDAHLALPSPFIQVLLGPRQVGKTTGVLAWLKTQPGPFHFASSDDVVAPDAEWIQLQWQLAQQTGKRALLVLDEIQKVPNWSQVVKGLWDRQTRSGGSLKVVLLGSGSLQIQKGLHESLAGRFQLVRAHHWDFALTNQLRRMSIEDFVRYGGYPGSYRLLNKLATWSEYIHHAIVEAVIGKDILGLSDVRKPALFRQAFALLMSHPAQEISYTKLLGQLQDAGNTDLVRRYIELYEGAYLMAAIHKFSAGTLRARTSSPKLIPLCGALIDRSVFEDAEGYGRAFEAAVGAALVRADLSPSYWRDGAHEVDYVVTLGRKLYAIEVKSGRRRSAKGLMAFKQLYSHAREVFVTPDNVKMFWNDPRAFLGSLT